jgi:hypothetical protein
VSLRAASQAFDLPDPSPSVRLRRLLQQSPDFRCRKTYNITKNCESKLYQNMAACGSTRCRCCTWPCRATQSPAAENDDDAPPSEDTMATFDDDTFLSPPFLHNSALWQSGWRSWGADVPNSGLLRLHREEENVRCLQGREDGEAIDRRWSNGSYNFVNMRDSIGNERWIV